MSLTRWLAVFTLAWSALSNASESILERAPERTYDIVIESGHLNVGVYRDFPPYSYEKGGEAVGVDIDIGRKIAEGLGVEFRVYWIIPDETLDDDLRNHIWKGHYLAKRRIADVMLRVPYDKTYAYMRDSTGEVINDQVVMFAPYQREQWQIAYDTHVLDDVGTMAVFQYHPIGVEIDTLPATYLTSTFAGQLRDNTRHFASMRQAFMAMVDGEVSAVMGMRAEIDHELGIHSDKGFEAAGNGFPGMGRQAWDVGMAVKHTHRQLGYAIEEIVDRMVREGEIAEIFERHGLRYGMPAFYEEILGDEEENSP
ncbi:substrate-binding periplasmic protein [Halomonas heilongjiangensis]|uniref:Amino acid ABC transporter substrate-binding protein n=1 Tax=Halomonas heilongjiangensis TaxID=1387883 RepID=A0A2N7TLC6_9GAMM|nr:transporter substrate-binding domain-containing protein [Halomonas heilongjiangensis]PMR68991.1 amino acid ABC transporter substrate-binding protein [Halomonas heilongjiangensis]PXX90051.1 amino acid ABC transporter substrate-binding protein [Halomonas heilongjiangensis]